MIANKANFFLGIFIFFIPFLGLPTFWKTFFIILSGVILVLKSLKVGIPKLIIRDRPKNEEESPINSENITVFVPPPVSEDNFQIRKVEIIKAVRRKRSSPKSSSNKTT